MTTPFDIDFDVQFSGRKTSEGDGITAAMLEAGAEDCGCGVPGGCKDTQEDDHAAE